MAKRSFHLARERHPIPREENASANSLAELVRAHLQAKGMRQIDFCRETGFDQGLLSKILSSVVSTLNIETALRLADGLGIPPATVFEIIGKMDLDDLLRRCYSNSETPGTIM